MPNVDGEVITRRPTKGLTMPFGKQCVNTYCAAPSGLRAGESELTCVKESLNVASIRDDRIVRHSQSATQKAQVIEV